MRKHSGPMLWAASEERGYALITAMLVLSVMTVLMMVTLATASSVNNLAEHGNRWTRTLAIAEGGLDDAITTLTLDRSAVTACPIGGEDVCTSPKPAVGDYQVSWSGSGSVTTITSKGYYPSQDDPDAITRTVRARFEPVPTFLYALYSDSALALYNNATVAGDVYAGSNVDIENNMIICGAIISQGTVNVEANVEIKKTYSYSDAFGNSRTCSGKSGDIWAAGDISMWNGAIVWGNAKASGELGCGYSITKGTVKGNATNCGATITSTVNGTKYPNTASATPPDPGYPQYTFDPANYSGLVCYPNTGTCAETNTSATAVSSFNTWSGGGANLHHGHYAIWQTAPSQAKVLNLSNLGGATGIDGDLTVVTNAPIDLGNTGTIQANTTSANVAIISLYHPPESTTCDEMWQEECSIFSGNKILFDPGTADPNDGLVVLLYTPEYGRMAFGNQNNEGDGALYSGGMDIANGYTVTYNSRIARQLGFGEGLERVSWQEINI